MEETLAHGFIIDTLRYFLYVDDNDVHFNRRLFGSDNFFSEDFIVSQL